MQRLLRVILVVGLTTVTCQCISAQQWHFSNGWAGGKRSSLSECHFRPQVKALVSRIIQDEITRLQVACSRIPFPDTQPYLQPKVQQNFEPEQ